MQFLKYIETKFENLSLLMKVELLLSPIILIVVFNYFNNEKYIPKKSFNNPFEINSLHMKKKIVDILNDIEKYAKKNSLELLDISNKSYEIKIRVSTKSIEKFLLFLKYLEDYNAFSKIISIDNSSDIKDIVISFHSFHIKKGLDLKIVKIKKHNSDIKIKFNLTAIVNKKAYINNQWFGVGDTIKLHKIVAINSNSVDLKKDNKIFVLEIFDDKKF